jgi:hypothetical protein
MLIPASGPPASDQDPFRLLRLVIALLLGLGTVLALGLWLSGLAPRALLLAGLFWALYGFVIGLIDGVLEPFVDLVASALQNAGLRSPGAGYSAIEALVAGGHYEAAAEDYLSRAQAGRGDTLALARRARLLAGPLGSPGLAVAELLNWRATRHLTASDDIRIGLTLAEMYDRPLGDPGRAMAELRRLLDLYPNAAGGRRARRLLNELRASRFGLPEQAS